MTHLILCLYNGLKNDKNSAKSRIKIREITQNFKIAKKFPWNHTKFVNSYNDLFVISRFECINHISFALFCQILAHLKPGGEGDSEGVVDDKFKLDKEDILIEFLANCDLLWCKLHMQYSLGFGSVTW